MYFSCMAVLDPVVTCVVLAVVFPRGSPVVCYIAVTPEGKSFDFQDEKQWKRRLVELLFLLNSYSKVKDLKGH